MPALAEHVACDPGYDVSVSNPCTREVRVSFANRRSTVVETDVRSIPSSGKQTWTEIGTWGDEVYFILLSGPRRAMCFRARRQT